MSKVISIACNLFYNNKFVESGGIASTIVVRMCSDIISRHKGTMARPALKYDHDHLDESLKHHNYLTNSFPIYQNNNTKTSSKKHLNNHYNKVSEILTTTTTADAQVAMTDKLANNIIRAKSIDWKDVLKYDLTYLSEHFKYYLLESAIDTARIDIVKKLLEEKSIDVNSKDEAGYTPLMSAVSHGTPEMVDYLLKMGAKANIKISDYDVTTPQVYASIRAVYEDFDIAFPILKSLFKEGIPDKEVMHKVQLYFSQSCIDDHREQYNDLIGDLDLSAEFRV
jgi:hypothetical protein